MTNKKDLAIFGGNKGINFKKPHWLWPPMSKDKKNSIFNYYKTGEKKNLMII